MLLFQLNNYDCSIFIPQQPCISNTNKPSHDEYISAVLYLGDLISDGIKADKNRIYLVGTSGGGRAVWDMIYRSPDYFACGIPVMGNFAEIHRLKEDIDFMRFLKTPLWVAHSSDDDNVLIDSDDYCVAELREIGADVRYTRWDKYGHKMSSEFYKREPWAEWMFKQVKK